MCSLSERDLELQVGQDREESVSRVAFIRARPRCEPFQVVPVDPKPSPDLVPVGFRYIDPGADLCESVGQSWIPLQDRSRKRVEHVVGEYDVHGSWVEFERCRVLSDRTQHRGSVRVTLCEYDVVPVLLEETVLAPLPGGPTRTVGDEVGRPFVVVSTLFLTELPEGAEEVGGEQPDACA